MGFLLLTCATPIKDLEGLRGRCAKFTKVQLLMLHKATQDILFELRRMWPALPLHCSLICQFICQPRLKFVPTELSTQMDYPYETLPSPNHIRVVQLHKGPSDAPISGSLILVDLNCNISYDCLSYTWGGPQCEDVGDEWALLNRHIVLDDVVVPIRRNLHDVLTAIRKLDIESLGLLWIDAICINQVDAAERNAQVSMMNKIYACAQKVIVWLGTTQTCCKQVVESLRRCQMSNEQIIELFKQCYDAYLLAHGRLFEEARLSEDEVCRIIEFFTNFNWFNRIWTAQEIALARSTLFLVGELVITQEIIDAASLVCLLGNGEVYDRINGAFGTTKWTALRRTQEYKALFNRTTREQLDLEFREIGVMAHNFREREATDPKDKVFGVHGISKPLLGYSMPVDYSFPIEYIYSQAQLHALFGRFGYAALGHVGPNSTKKITSLPTWVPDFTTPEYQRPMAMTRKTYSAATRFPRGVYCDFGNPSVVNVIGSYFDTIEATCAAWWEDGDVNCLLEMMELIRCNKIDPTDIADAGVKLNELLTAITTRYISIPDDVTAGYQVWASVQEKILLDERRKGSQENSKGNGTERLSDNSRLLLSMFRSLRSNIIEDEGKFHYAAQTVSSAIEDAQVRTLNYIRKGYIDSSSSHCLTVFLSDWEETCKKRRMFRTTRGYLGLTLPDVKIGDRVYLLSGGEVPQVFRPVQPDSQKDFEYVGEAYVQGIMDGEASESLEFKIMVIH